MRQQLCAEVRCGPVMASRDFSETITSDGKLFFIIKTCIMKNILALDS